MFTGGDPGIAASLECMWRKEGPERASRGMVFRDVAGTCSARSRLIARASAIRPRGSADGCDRPASLEVVAAQLFCPPRHARLGKGCEQRLRSR
jgi:hypothetical protein